MEDLRVWMQFGENMPGHVFSRGAKRSAYSVYGEREEAKPARMTWSDGLPQDSLRAFVRNVRKRSPSEPDSHPGGQCGKCVSSIMKKFQQRVRVIDRVEVAENTMAIFLSKPAGFSFVPGAHIGLILPHLSETDGGGNRRDFSLACAPFEKELMVAMRLRDSAFKNSLARLPLNEELLMEGPFGSFRLHTDTAAPAVFIAGGIGVAPFISMLRQEHHDGFPRAITLLYSNRRPEDAAFLQELQKLADIQPRFTFVPTMTNLRNCLKSSECEATRSENPSRTGSYGEGLSDAGNEADRLFRQFLKDATAPWAGEIGRISKDMIAKHVSNLSAPLCYIAGSPAMVAAMEKMFMGAGVSPDNIRTEEFAGY